jgi:hypothetical protein
MKYSVIVTFYHKDYEDELKLYRCLNSLADAIHLRKDVEILVIHDGPVNVKYRKGYESFVKFYNTPIRCNKWGHNSRDYGLTHASGEYILHTNYDNYYYPDVFNMLDTYIVPEIKLYSMSVRMMGMLYNEKDKSIGYTTPRDYSYWTILNGKYIRKGMVDCMQIIAARELWDEVGGWKDWSVDSDGKYYEQMASKHKYLNIPMCMGEHY